MSTLSIVLAAIISFAVGWIWYGPLFGKTWMKLSGISMQDMQSQGLKPAQAMTIGFVFALVVAFVFSRFLGMLSISDVSGAIQLAAWVWFGFAMPIQAGSWLWEGKSFKLFLFNTVYQVIVYAVIASALVLI